MYNLSELIKTDCCIDCGTNEKLREVVGKIGIPQSITQSVFGVAPSETQIYIFCGIYATCRDATLSHDAIPLASINIDL